MQIKFILTVVSILAIACVTLASNVYIHVHRTTPGELGIYCSNGDQVEYITLNGPFGVIRCENCRHQFAGNDLPREIDKAWLAAIEEVEAQR
jgi:hypothetical protein